MDFRLLFLCFPLKNVFTMNMWRREKLWEIYVMHKDKILFSTVISIL